MNHKVKKYKTRRFGSHSVVTALCEHPQLEGKTYELNIGEIFFVGIHTFRGDSEKKGYLGIFDKSSEAKNAIIQAFETVMVPGE